MQGLRRNSALFWAPEKARGEAANSKFLPVLGVGDP